jgi:hypothetical protein
VAGHPVMGQWLGQQKIARGTHSVATPREGAPNFSAIHMARRPNHMGADAMILLVKGDASGSPTLQNGLMAGTLSRTAVSVPVPVKQTRFFAIECK